GWDGVVHHALAFNTLLSSQETDAFTVDPDPQTRFSGAFRSFRCAFILSDRLFRVKPLFRSDFLRFHRPEGNSGDLFRGNPLNLPASERLCEPINAAVRFKGISGNTVQATPKSPK
ncbi:hypothetical protein, partial [Streptosporangium sandarakinum]|uniref:hypothetical protein n=1 Tax=Streptosporangium sandarakinum TaxID=1260955 RepID=UPI0037A49665